MRCPNCGAKFNKMSNVCLHCGTHMSQLHTASNRAIKKARKEYQPELVVYSSVFPSDLSYKKTLLLCIFLGYMGAHRYYTLQKLSAILMTLAMLGLLFVSFFLGGYLAGYYVPQDLGISMYTFNSIISILSILAVISLIRWLFDIILLATKRYKVPVVLGEKQEKGK